MSQNNNFA